MRSLETFKVIKRSGAGSLDPVIGSKILRWLYPLISSPWSNVSTHGLQAHSPKIPEVWNFPSLAFNNPAVTRMEILVLVSLLLVYDIWDIFKLNLTYEISARNEMTTYS